jgi:hypothetical protein
MMVLMRDLFPRPAYGKNRSKIVLPKKMIMTVMPKADL